MWLVQHNSAANSLNIHFDLCQPWVARRSLEGDFDLWGGLVDQLSNAIRQPPVVSASTVFNDNTLHATAAYNLCLLFGRHVCARAAADVEH